MAFTTVWQLCSEKGKAHTARQILLEVLGCSHWQIWGVAKVTAGYRFHIFSLDCNLTKRRAWKWSPADRNKLWSGKVLAQSVSVSCQNVYFLGTSYPLCGDVHPWHSIKQKWLMQLVVSCLFSLQINKKMCNYPPTLTFHKVTVDTEGLKSSKWCIIPKPLPLASRVQWQLYAEEAGQIQAKSCALQCPVCWGSLLGPETSMLCCGMFFWSLSKSTLSLFAVSVLEKFCQLWTHWKA